MTWETIAVALGLVQQSDARARAEQAALEPVGGLEDEAERDALPAGHPVTWGAITAPTCMAGAAYPFPVFSFARGAWFARAVASVGRG